MQVRHIIKVNLKLELTHTNKSFVVRYTLNFSSDDYCFITLLIISVVEDLNCSLKITSKNSNRYIKKFEYT